MHENGWLVVEGVELDEIALRSHNIPYAPVTINRPVDYSGYAFPEEMLPELKELFSFDTYGRTRMTSLEGVYMIRSREEVSEPEPVQVVLNSDSNMEQWREMKPVFEKYAALLKLSFNVANCQDNVSHIFTPVDEPGWLYVRFWATSMRTGETHYPRVFDTRISTGQSDGVLPSSHGVDITDSYQTVAQLVGGTLYILFDLPHTGTPAAPVLDQILQKVAGLIDPAIQAEYLAKQNAEQAERSRDNYIKLCANRATSQRRRLQTEIDTALSSQRDYGRYLVECIRQGKQALKQLAALEAEAEKDTAFYAAEYEKLLSMPEVAGVVVTDTHIQIKTTHLTTHPLSDETCRDLGVYTINIPIDGDDISVVNQTRTVNGYAHPHTTGTRGVLCLGNIREGVTRLVADYEFSVVATMLIEFLKTINEPDDYGRRIWSWPLVGSDETGDLKVYESDEEDYFDEEDYEEEDDYGDDGDEE